MKSIVNASLFILFLTQICFSQWLSKNSLLEGSSLYSVFFIDKNMGWSVGDSGTILKSTDGGLTWIFQNSNTTADLRSVYFFNQNKGWVAGIGGIVLKTTDGGVNWSSQAVSAFDLWAVQFINADTGWVSGSTTLKTTNGGAGWEEQMHYGGFSLSFVDESYGWIAGYYNLHKTTDGGTHWTSFANNYDLWSIFFYDHDNGWAVGEHEFYSRFMMSTTDGGENWTTAPSNSEPLRSIYFVDSLMGWAAGFYGTILHTSDGGVNWENQASGVGESLLALFFINSDYGWVVGNGGILIRTSNGGRTWSNGSFSSIYEEAGYNMAASLVLDQNYPNPFNPTTTINFQLSQNGYVTLRVYDILGKEVATLVNEQKNHGRYSVNFNASNLASGVYIYQLRVNEYASTKKMLLLE